MSPDVVSPLTISTAFLVETGANQSVNQGLIEIFKRDGRWNRRPLLAVTL